jgi:hypothetical protein
VSPAAASNMRSDSYPRSLGVRAKVAASALRVIAKNRPQGSRILQEYVGGTEMRKPSETPKKVRVFDGMEINL